MSILSLLLRSLFSRKSAPLADETMLLASASVNKGNVCYEEGNLGQAVRHYEQALKMDSGNNDALLNLSSIYLIQDQYSKAEQLLNQTIEIKPELYQAYLLKIQIFLKRGEWLEAEKLGHSIIRLFPDCVEGYFHLANIYTLQARFDEAELLLNQALELKRDFYKAELLQLQILLRKGHLEQAATLGEALIQHYPECANAYVSLGDIYKEQRRYLDAQCALKKAIELEPKDSTTYLLYSHLLLLLNDFKNGWTILDKGEENSMHTIFSSHSKEEYLEKKFTPLKYSKDNDFCNKKLVFLTVFGLGDNILFLRYLSLFKERYRPQRISVVCEPPLVRIFQSLSVVDEVITKSASLKIPSDQFDYQCALPNLPSYFETQIDTIPDHFPYIVISNTDKKRWADRVTSLPGLKIGVVWGGGNILNNKDSLRSIPLIQFKPLFAIKGVHWISLQKGNPANQLKLFSYPIIDWTADLHDLYDTAALIENLDLTISVDTSVINLVGALGRPGWVLNRYGSEWRWMCNRDSSPWYPSIRIFDQSELHNWDGVIKMMADQLQSLMNSYPLPC